MDAFPLLDRSLLRVSAGWMGGPHGAIYPEGFAPDIVIGTSTPVDPPEDDPVVQAASDWLRQQPGCDLAATRAA